MNATIIIAVIIVAIAAALVISFSRNNKKNAAYNHRRWEARNQASKASKPTRETDTMEELTEDEVPADVLDALKAGNKLLAIKLYKEHKNCGLIEARDFIDNYKFEQ